MKIVSAQIHAMRIPFKMMFSHHLMARAHSDSIIVKLTAENGESGYGEGVPRPYVTGESVSTCLERIQRIVPLLAKQDFGKLCGRNNPPITLLKTIDVISKLPGKSTVIGFHAAQTALELALLDLLLKGSGRSLGCLLPPRRETVDYSVGISAESTDKAREIARRCAEFGIKAVKIKVGMGDDYARISTVRDILGDSVSLRLDANGAFTVQSALKLLSSVQHLNIVCIEQPVPRGDIPALARVTRDSPIAVMVDESLVTLQDGEELIAHGACDLFNLRISKNGGVYRTLQLAEMARKANIGFQLGCQVGETAILSAAGRHMAAHLSDARFVEGSYGTLLLEEDISTEPVTFGYGGRAGILVGNGLGIDIDEERLQKYSEKTISMELDSACPPCSAK